VRGIGSPGRLLVVLACAAVVAGSATRNNAQASHCLITPTLAKATVGQGLPYAQLVRGKETLVKAYLTLPATLPKCAGTSGDIKIVGASLTMRNGTTPLVTVSALPDAVGALVTSKSTMKNQYADPKFVVQGSQVPPSGSGIAGSFTASFTISVQYQSRGRGEVDYTSTQTANYTSAAGSPISRVIEGPTKALRILAVPGPTPLDSTMTSTLQASLTALSGMYPVPDLTGSGQPRVGVLPTTSGGIRYALNNPGALNLGTPFCGTSGNYAAIQTQLQAFHNAWNDANTTENDVDRTIGVVPSNVSTGSPGCYEGFTITNSREAWVRLVPDGAEPSMTGSLLAMEGCHTFGCTTSTATFHSLYANADNLAENTDLAFNPLTWSWLSDDRTAMRFTAPGWNNQTTVLEKGDFGYLLCGLGGANTSGCPATGVGTLTGVPAGPTFLLDGTTDGTGEGTTVINSFSSTIQPETTPAPTSAYRLIQKPGGQDLGVPVRFVHSGHSEGHQDVGPNPIGAFSFAFPFVAGTTRIEFVKRNASGPPTLLYAANQTAAPEIDGVEVSGGSGPITFLQQRGAPQHSTTPKETAGGLATAASSSDPPGTAPPGDVGIAAAGAGTGLSTTYVFTGNAGYSADGLGQNVTGGTIQAEVPTGSTVKKAFLYGTYFGGTNPSDSQRTIAFDGTTIVTAKIGDDGSNLATARADVTTQVAAKVGSGGGTTNFEVESDPPNLDGVGLVVVYSNPALPTRTVAVLDGSADQGGDTTTFTYASPLDKTIAGFSATMSLGIGFGFQGGSGAGTSECGPGVSEPTPSFQFSLVDVNDDRLTSCAGNYDDGIGENGALITVGGVGDDTANPADPLQQPGDGQEERVDDDELYDIASFTEQGDTELTITTSNPSQDDNLFLAVVQIAAQTTVANEICDDEVDNDGDNLVDFADSDCAPGTVQTEATDADNPNDLRATCYVDWGGVKYPVQVGVLPSSVNEETGKAKFLCSFDPDQVGVTGSGTAQVTAVVHDSFTQSAPATETFDSFQTPPVASIAAPSPDGTTFLQFDTIVLRGSALDAEQGHLTEDALTWTASGGLIGGTPPHREHVFLQPPPGGWTPGSYTITLTATDAANNTSFDDVTVEILPDADHDGIPAGEEATGCGSPPGSDSNPLDATDDPDLDGIPSVDDQHTTGGTCGAETTYSAIIDWNPDDFNRNTSGTPITVKVQVPYRSVSQIVPASVKITKVIYVDSHGEIAEANPNQQATEWSAKGQDGTAKFARQPFIGFLNTNQIPNQRIVVEVSGNFSGTPTTQWAGRDSTNVK
jgi:hypothetical protein